MSDKEMMMKYLQAADFAVFETALYLDTHPTDEKALAYMQKHTILANQIRSEYIADFGPLQVTDITSDCYWEWVASPWPWELEG